jgi:hypothetical protein
MEINNGKDNENVEKNKDILSGSGSSEFESDSETSSNFYS